MTNQRKTALHGHAKAAIKQKLNANFIKNSLNPRDYYQHELPKTAFKKQDWNDGGLCPFHSDHKPGSFRVNLITGAYKCFACGAAGGDVIAFAMALYGLQFVDALAKLADDWGLA